MKELRLPPELRQSDFARALDINKSGVIVGSAVPVGSPDDIAIALVWPSHNEEARVLPLPPGASLRNAIAFAVNDRGDIVGEAFPSDDFGFAVIWRNEGATVTILPGLVVDPDPRHRCDTLDMAVDINQRGEIAAASFDTCGPRFEERDAYRLVPVKP
jgi:hypothetical protein